MFFRMLRGAIVRQRGKLLLIAFTIALGASLATAMLNTVMDVGDKVNEELKTYGANITVKPKDSSLLSSIYSVEEEDGETALNTSYLDEAELPNIKTIFWAFNIVDYSPFLETRVSFEDGTGATAVGAWFNHHMELPTGETLDAGLTSLRSWWDLTEGTWIDEQDESVVNPVMVGTVLAEELDVSAGSALLISGPEGEMTATVVGIYDAGGDEDEELYGTLDFVQELSGLSDKVASIEVSALTTPDNELAIRAAQNPAALSSSDYETWYCTAYVSSICYQIQEVITNSTASAVRQVADSEGTILEKTQLLMLLITALSLVASALGISNLVTASVMERSQEIALFKAIGAHDGAITKLIMSEILLTALAGSVVGYFAGLGFAQLIGQTVFGSAIDMNVLVIPIVAVLIFVVTIAGSLPAIRMALRLDPAVVLHGSNV